MTIVFLRLSTLPASWLMQPGGVFSYWMAFVRTVKDCAFDWGGEDRTRKASMKSQSEVYITVDYFFFLIKN